MKKIPAAGGIVLNELGQVLIICRRSKWDFPKGHVDPGETYERCALREVREETGLQKLSIVRPIGITEHKYFDSRLREEVNKETHWFEMKATVKEQLRGQAEEDIEWIFWVSPAELPKYLRNSYGNVIEIVRQAGLIEDWEIID